MVTYVDFMTSFVLIPQLDNKNTGHLINNRTEEMFLPIKTNTSYIHIIKKKEEKLSEQQYSYIENLVSSVDKREFIVGVRPCVRI